MAFAIPALNDLVYRMKNHADRAACPGRAAPYVLIVTPTNLLAKQTVGCTKIYFVFSSHTPLSVLYIYVGEIVF